MKKAFYTVQLNTVLLALSGSICGNFKRICHIIKAPTYKKFYKRGLQSRTTKTKTFFYLGGRCITDV